jgi:anti-anti-sigma factor
MRDQLDPITCDTIMPAAPLSEPTVTTTVSCPQPDLTVCRVTGSVDLIAAPALADKFSEALRDGRPHLVIDLSAVALFNSIGLQIVFEALDCCDLDGHLAIVVDPRSAAIIQPGITALGEVIDIHHDLAGALRACARAAISTGGRHRAKATN